MIFDGNGRTQKKKKATAKIQNQQWHELGIKTITVP